MIAATQRGLCAPEIRQLDYRATERLENTSNNFANDEAQFAELRVEGELTEYAWAHGVQSLS